MSNPQPLLRIGGDGSLLVTIVILRMRGTNVNICSVGLLTVCLKSAIRIKLFVTLTFFYFEN